MHVISSLCVRLSVFHAFRCAASENYNFRRQSSERLFYLFMLFFFICKLLLMKSFQNGWSSLDARLPYRGLITGNCWHLHKSHDGILEQCCDTFSIKSPGIWFLFLFHNKPWRFWACGIWGERTAPYVDLSGNFVITKMLYDFQWPYLLLCLVTSILPKCNKKSTVIFI